MTTILTCKKCGRQSPACEIQAFSGRCENCFADGTEKQKQVDRDRKDNTDNSPKRPHGFAVERHGRKPGTGEGNDYSGNHT